MNFKNVFHRAYEDSNDEDKVKKESNMTSKELEELLVLDLETVRDIHVPCEDDYNLLMEFFHSYGIRWAGGTNARELNAWRRAHREKTIIVLYRTVKGGLEIAYRAFGLATDNRERGRERYTYINGQLLKPSSKGEKSSSLNEGLVKKKVEYILDTTKIEIGDVLRVELKDYVGIRNYMVQDISRTEINTIYGVVPRTIKVEDIQEGHTIIKDIIKSN